MSPIHSNKLPMPVMVQHALQELGRRAVILRKARDLTQADLAHLANVGISTVAAIEGGHDGVSLGNVLKVLDAMELLEQAGAIFDPKSDPYMSERTERIIAHLGRATRPRTTDGGHRG